MAAYKNPLTNRRLRNYWRNVDKQPTGCWIWTGGLNPCGTGNMTVLVDGVRLHTTHRVAWYLAHGEVLDRKIILLHTCGNKLCVNPDHLEKSTYEDRMSLRWIEAQPEPEKVKHNRAAMTPEEAAYIRDLRFNQHKKLIEICEITGRTYKTVSFIVNNKTHNGIRKGPKPGSKRRK